MVCNNGANGMDHSTRQACAIRLLSIAIVARKSQWNVVLSAMLVRKGVSAKYWTIIRWQESAGVARLTGLTIDRGE